MSSFFSFCFDVHTWSKQTEFKSSESGEKNIGKQNKTKRRKDEKGGNENREEERKRKGKRSLKDAKNVI